MPQHFVLGIAGASGSGKTTLANALLAEFPGEACILSHDSYYHDRSRLPTDERGQINFDALEAIETSLFVQHLQQLKAGHSVKVPQYDFGTHTRGKAVEVLNSRPLIIVEGIMLLAEPAIRELLDLRIFMDTDPDVCLLRRIQRDVTERERTVDGVMEQYERTVKPFFDSTILPCRKHADLTVVTNDFERLLSAIRRLTKMP